MKKFTIYLCLILFLVGVAVGCVSSEIYQANKQDKSIQSEEQSINVANITALAKSGMGSLAVYPVVGKVISCEFKPDDVLEVYYMSTQLASIETDEVTASVTNLVRLTVNYTSSNDVIDEILVDDNTTSSISLLVYCDVDNDALLTYCGHTSGKAYLLDVNMTSIINDTYSYIYDANIRVYSQNWCYEYTLVFTSVNQLSLTNLTTALNSILATCTYDDSIVIFLSDSVKPYTLFNEIYILN